MSRTAVIGYWPRLRRVAVSYVAAVAILLGGPCRAWALWDDQLELFAHQSLTSDDNIFRVPGGSTTDDRSDPADTYRTTTAGIRLDVERSAQRFFAELALREQRFDRLTALDNDARSVAVTWVGELAERFAGQFAYRDDELLASFENLQSGVQDSNGNILQHESVGLQADFDISPTWKLRGGLLRENFENSALRFQASDARISGASIAAIYASTEENEIGVEFARRTGDLPKLQRVGTALIDNSYSQDSVIGMLGWRPSGRSRLAIRAGRVARKFDQFPGRNFADWVLGAQYEWQAASTLTLALRARHELSTTEQINVGFVVVESLTLQPVWAVTDKLSVSASIERGTRHYHGDLGFGPATAAPAVVEDVRSTTLSMTYQPLRQVSVVLNLYKTSRDFSLGGVGYGANIASLEFRVSL